MDLPPESQSPDPSCSAFASIHQTFPGDAVSARAGITPVPPQGLGLVPKVGQGTVLLSHTASLMVHVPSLPRPTAPVPAVKLSAQPGQCTAPGGCFLHSLPITNPFALKPTPTYTEPPAKTATLKRRKERKSSN